MRLSGAWSPEHAWKLHSSWVFLTARLHHTSLLFFSSLHVFIGDHGEGSSFLAAEVPTVSSAWVLGVLGVSGHVGRVSIVSEQHLAKAVRCGLVGHDCVLGRG